MKVDRRTGFLVAISVAIIVPIIFLIVFANIEHPSIKPTNVLPFYGKRTPVVLKDVDGKEYVDTIYHTVPSFSFVSHLGDTITSSFMKGRVSVVDYFFTTCPNICIDMAKNKLIIQEHFLNDNDVLILSHTVDPETDSVPQLYRYAQENFVNSKVWLLLTGDKPALYQQAREGYMITATQGDGGVNDFIHSERFVLIDKEGRIRGYYDGTSAVETQKLIKDIERLLVSYVVPMKNSKGAK
jgi:protein SCO1